MKILHINGTSEGGTFKVYDLHKALIKKKIKSNIYLPRKNRYKKFTLSKSFFFNLLKNC